MITLGVDVGSLFAKAVLLDGDQILASRIKQVTGNLARELEPFMQNLLNGAEVERGAVEASVSTGRGAGAVPGVDFEEDELYCIGQAVHHYLPGVNHVLDMGGQSITALALDGGGEVKDFMRNDKCASGTGRFLEVMSEALGFGVFSLDRVAVGADQAAPISTQCGVFVESEVITHLNAGMETNHIAAGLCQAAARIVASQARRFGLAGDYTLTGGVARLDVVTDFLDRRLEARYHPYPQDPQLAAALGAALAATEE